MIIHHPGSAYFITSSVKSGGKRKHKSKSSQSDSNITQVYRTSRGTTKLMRRTGINRILTSSLGSMTLTLRSSLEGNSKKSIKQALSRSEFGSKKSTA